MMTMSNNSRQSRYTLQHVPYPILHDPPTVYGMQQYYQPVQQNMMAYPPPTMYYPPPTTQQLQHSPSSSSTSSGGSPRTPPKQPSPTIMSMNLTTEERVKETIARANALPVEFFETEFLEYSQKSYEVQHHSKKRKRTTSDNSTRSFKKFTVVDQDEDEERLNSNELRRQVHIQSEQKRRAQIKDGFEVLKSHLPGCANKKMSKATLLTRTVQQLEHMKKMQTELLAEVERLAEENLNLKSLTQSNSLPY